MTEIFPQQLIEALVAREIVDATLPFGIVQGHNGGGPGYQSSVFHLRASEDRTMAVCAMCASECPGLAERLVFGVFAELTGCRAARTAE